MYKIVTTDLGESIISRDNANGSTSWIPEAESNADYREYLEWLSEGNEPEVIEG